MKNYNIEMKKFNGYDYDILYPKTKQENISQLSTTVKNLIISNIDNQLPISISTEINNILPSSISTEINNQVPIAVSTAISTGEILDKISIAVSTQVDNQVPIAISTAIYNYNIPIAVSTNISTEINNQIPIAISTAINNYDIPTSVSTAILNEINNQVPIAVSTEVESQVPSSVPVQIQIKKYIISTKATDWSGSSASYAINNIDFSKILGYFVKFSGNISDSRSTERSKFDDYNNGIIYTTLTAYNNKINFKNDGRTISTDFDVAVTFFVEV